MTQPQPVTSSAPRRSPVPVVAAALASLLAGLIGGVLLGSQTQDTTAPTPQRLGEPIELQWPDDLDTALLECAHDHDDSAYALVPLDRQPDGLTVNWGTIECYEAPAGS